MLTFDTVVNDFFTKKALSWSLSPEGHGCGYKTNELTVHK